MKKRKSVFLSFIIVAIFIFKSELIYDGIKLLVPYLYNLQYLITGERNSVDKQEIKITNADGKEITENRIDINTGEKIDLEKEMLKVKNIPLLDEKEIWKMTLEEQVVQYIYKYSKDGSYILRASSAISGEDEVSIVKKWNNDGELFKTINKTVHEECHYYQGKVLPSKYNIKNRKWNFTRAHIDNYKPYGISFIENEIMESSLMGEEIEPNFRTDRWGVYVSKDSKTSSNLNGIYGLLDEFEAYYYGDKAVYDMYSAILKLPYDKERWMNYYFSMDGTAFYEFKFFILRYMIYAKEHDIKTYNKIKQDEKFMQILKSVYKNYEAYVETSMVKRKAEMLSYLKKKGHKAYFEDGYFYIDDKGIKNGVEVGKIKREMKKPEYLNMMKELGI